MCFRPGCSRVLTLPSLCFLSNKQITVSSISTSLTNFKNAKAFYREKILEGNDELSNICTGDSSVISIFRQIFPELVQSRGITMLDRLDSKKVTIELWDECELN